jgi:hypothetical protein
MGGFMLRNGVPQIPKNIRRTTGDGDKEITTNFSHISENGVPKTKSA